MTPYTVRFPDDLYAQIQHAARAQRRSIQKEILWLIEQGLKTLPRSDRSPMT